VQIETKAKAPLPPFDPFIFTFVVIIILAYFCALKVKLIARNSNIAVFEI
jgi:hypothetical protein